MLKSRTMKYLLLLALLFAGCSKPADPPLPPELLSMQNVIDSLAPLPIDKPFHFDEANDPNNLLGRPDQYTAKMNFKDPETKDADLSIEIFPNHERAEARCQYIRSVGNASPLFAKYCYVNRNAVLHIDSKMTPYRAGEYERAFRGIIASTPLPSISV